ncbi:MAG: hypothetical protein G01um101438_544 [Parcubacteria group bacterium Gr01-1014_38]|nr:MAG: hypothetical protein G01um101438_544 [Parcubacteria group bacterium Gr01-1014_38]
MYSSDRTFWHAEVERGGCSGGRRYSKVVTILEEIKETMGATSAMTRKQTAVLYDDLFDRFDEGAFAFAVKESERYYALPDVRGKRCLDVEGGAGAFISRLFQAGALEVHGVDIGEKNCVSVLHWNKPWKDRLVVKQGSVESLEYPDGFFDFVHSGGVVHHLVQPEQGFEELARVTKPGGLTVIGVYGRGGLMPFTISVLRRIASLLPYSLVSRVVSWFFSNPYSQYLVLDFLYVPIVHRYREEDIRRWYEDAGYTDITRSRLHARYTYGSLSAHLFHGEGYITLQGRKR